MVAGGVDRVPGAEVRGYASDRRGLTLNVFLGVAGGALAALAETLLLPIIVLAFFVGQLTTSYEAVGFVPAIGIGLWALGRIPASILVSGQRRKQPWAVAASLIKATATALLAFVSFRVAPGDLAVSAGPLLRTFFICWVAYSLAGGFASIPTAALVAKAIPDEARAMFYRQRGLWTGVAGLVAGLVVAQLFRVGGPAFPRNYALLFLAATICQLAAIFFMLTLKEPLRVAPGLSVAPGAILRAIPDALADPNFRRYIVFRALLSAAAVIDPFLVIFGLARLGIAPASIGGYVVAFVLGRMLATPVWGAVERRSGDKPILQVSALLRLVPPVAALVLPYVASAGGLENAFAGGTRLSTAFGAIYFVLGAVAAGQGRANFAYIAEVTSPRLRGVYAGVTNAILALIALAPVVGGRIIARSEYETLFLIGAAVALLAVFASGALTNAFVRPLSTPAIRRFRRPPRTRAVALREPGLPPSRSDRL
jgi:hypothetical protein